MSFLVCGAKRNVAALAPIVFIATTVIACSGSDGGDSKDLTGGSSSGTANSDTSANGDGGASGASSGFGALGSKPPTTASSGTTTTSGSSSSGTSGSFGSSSSGASGATGGATNQCSGKIGTDACSSCLEKSCCNEVVACVNDQACVGFYQCFQKCTDDACIQSCAGQYPAGVAPLRAVGQCQSQKCGTNCQ